MKPNESPPKNMFSLTSFNKLHLNLIALCPNCAQSSKSSWFEHLKHDVLILWLIFIRNSEHSKSMPKHTRICKCKKMIRMAFRLLDDAMTCEMKSAELVRWARPGALSLKCHKKKKKHVKP